MRLRLLAAGTAALLLGGCGGGSPSTTSTSATTTVGVYFFKDGALTRVPAAVTERPAIATAALGALLAGPPAGYETAIPGGARLTSLAVAGGSASATFSGLGEPGRPAQAQIVSTLAQFPTVKRVSIDVQGRGAVTLSDGAGTPLGAGATAADYDDLTAEAPIFVREPPRDATVSSPVRAAGSAITFEGTFTAEVWSGGRLLRTQTITATAGSGTRGTWSATFDLPPGPAKLVFYEPSAEDGSPLHTTTVFLTVR